MRTLRRTSRTVILTALSLVGVCASARADDTPILPVIPSQDVPLAIDSGFVGNDVPGSGPQIVFSTIISVPEAVWLRLSFADATLSGDPANDNCSYLLITSLHDGYWQYLNGESVAQWYNTSAYFNGDAVRVELIASPGTGQSRLAINSVTAGIGDINTRTICDTTDDRVLSSDPRDARLLSVGCSVWLFNDFNKQFLTAGHCTPSTSMVVQFNVPLSTTSGGLVNPPPQDQYTIDAASIQTTNGGLGNDNSYFGCVPNSTTGLTPIQVQGQYYTLANAAAPQAGQTIRITGYGTVSSPVSLTWNQVQKTHVGPYVSLSGTTAGYRTDTTGGNSGSPIVLEQTGNAIGIHTNAGCGSGGSGFNTGTAIQQATAQAKLNNPLGICRSGNGAVSPPIYVTGDLNNNFGTVNRTTGVFGKVSQIPALMQGLAYNPNIDMFYGVDNSRRLYTIDPDTGASTLIATISGTTLVINGLGYDPNATVLYGMAASNGQLFSIDTATAAATAIGAAAGGNVGGIDYDPATNTLFGVDDQAAGTRLVTINTTDGSRGIIGNLLAGVNDCNGLAYCDVDQQLYTINAANEQVLRVNPATGAATVVGASTGVFGAAYGMATRLAPPNCPGDLNGDRQVNENDLGILLAAWNAGPGGDLDGDGDTDESDLGILLANWGANCP
ncbi:MAG: hypothetical protein U1D55_01465 [Phycisphaerae bacterium]